MRDFVTRHAEFERQVKVAYKEDCTMSLKDKLKRIQALKKQDPCDRPRNSRYEDDLVLIDDLEELYDADGVLSDWERDRFEDWRDRTRRDRRVLTDGQRDKVEEILGDKG